MRRKIDFSDSHCEGAHRMSAVKKDETKFGKRKTADDVEALMKANK